MTPADDYIKNARRSNLERLDYMRQVLASEVDALDESVNGTFGVEAPVLRGRIGKVKIVRIRNQQE